MEAKIVVGTQFGDEGKGRTVDYLIQHSEKPIVVRFSGGQNCGHTVINKGIKHIFSNYGSGTMRGVVTYISEHCTLYLNSIETERKLLISKGFTPPKLLVHPKAMLTTPYDIAYNRMLCKITQHGSCGVGISTTMKRNLETGYKLYANDIKYPKVFLAKLQKIKEYYISLPGFDLNIFNAELGYSEEKFISLIQSDLFDVCDYDVLKHYNPIFEGSQGIMLDMDHGIFPNVTYANTTSKNALEICNKIGIDSKDIHTYYVTRCYQTRHGNGWMSNQEPIALINNEEEINVLNDYQGQFKIGELDYEILNYAIKTDLLYHDNKFTNKTLVITCLDQRPDFCFDKTKLEYYFDYKNGYLTFNNPSN